MPNEFGYMEHDLTDRVFRHCTRSNLQNTNKNAFRKVLSSAN